MQSRIFSSLQCHMIPKKHFLLLSMLKTVVLLKVSLMNRKFNKRAFI